MAKRNDRTGRLETEYLGLESMADMVDTIAGLSKELNTIAEQWETLRSVQPTSELRKILPDDLIDLLDQVAEIYICEETDCRELAHKDWDFCKEHGAKKPKIPPNYS